MDLILTLLVEHILPFHRKRKVANLFYIHYFDIYLTLGYGNMKYRLLNAYVREKVKLAYFLFILDNEQSISVSHP